MLTTTLLLPHTPRTIVTGERKEGLCWTKNLWIWQSSAQPFQSLDLCQRPFWPSSSAWFFLLFRGFTTNACWFSRFYCLGQILKQQCGSTCSFPSLVAWLLRSHGVFHSRAASLAAMTLQIPFSIWVKRAFCSDILLDPFISAMDWTVAFPSWPPSLWLFGLWLRM